jgi:hypothetical protein
MRDFKGNGWSSSTFIENLQGLARKFMFTFSLPLSRYRVLCLVLVFLAHPLRAELQEPPLKCEITRGSWCIVKGISEIRFANVQNGKWHKWALYDEYWKKDVGIVLEGTGCVDTAADTIELVEVHSNVLWEGRRWKEAVVSIRRDRTCELRLMVPTNDIAFVKKAGVH